MNDPSPPPENPKPRKFSPSKYYRQRRPNLFSDSQKTTEVVLSREVLSHHLDTLTNQKGETVFEGFASRLVEKFIAPNLRPQTGPVGGGDGKTDAETYPVSSIIAERWFVPETAASQERWAFAFSAKKDWRAKVRSDVQKIAETQRGYPRIYFVTNQYVPAKDSAHEQDELTKKYGIPVTILDRTWLLDSVIDKNSLDIAAQTLGVGGNRVAVELGPRDHENTIALEKLEKALADGTQYQGAPPTLAEDTLQAAELARGLEKPRYEIDGRYERAVRIARDHKLQSHELRAVYGWAWTSFMFYDDPAKLNALYDDVERLAISSDKADDLELLNNLLSLLTNAVDFGVLTADAGAIDKRRAALMESLDRVRNDESRPNNALQAYSLHLTQQLTQIVHARDLDKLDGLWAEFTDVIKKADGLGTFPFESLCDVLTEMGEFVPESPAFDTLYEALTDALATRKSEGEAAKKNSERGYQVLNKDLPYEAIRWFGRAVSLLVKEEYEDELIEALIGSSIAYHKAGLYWAARNYAFAATTQEFTDFHKKGQIERVNPAVLSQLFESELALGRIPYALSAYEIGAMVRNGRSRTDAQRKYADERRIDQGNRLAALALSTSFDDLKRIGKLPDGLERLGLEQVRVALLFLMGREDVLRADGTIPPDEKSEDLEELFGQWAEMAKVGELTNPDYLLNDNVLLKSRILGCEIEATCENTLTSLAVGEALLGTLEALLATSLSLRTFPHLDKLEIRVSAKADAPVTPSLEMKEEKGKTLAVVTHAPLIRHNSRAEAEAFCKWLQESVLRLFVTFAIPADHEQWAETVLGKENGFSRAVTFSQVPTMASVMYGDKESLSINEWIEDKDTEYGVKREAPWVSPVSTPEADEPSEPPTPGSGEPPKGLFNTEKLRHSDFKVVSPIDVRKWDAAKWRAAFFVTQPGGPMPPVLGLAFTNREPAVAIFQGLRERFGEHDPDNALRVAIVTGVRKSNPHAYAVIVGPNMDKIPRTQGVMFSFVQRIQIMTPKDSRNLDLFLSEYARHEKYLLAAAHLPDVTKPPEPIYDPVLGKYHLEVRPAWQVSENDPDNLALDLDDPPVIPADQPNAPVIKALEQLRRLRSRK